MQLRSRLAVAERGAKFVLQSDEVVAAGSHPPEKRGEVVHGSAAVAAIAVPAVLGLAIHMQARRLIVMERAANLAVPRDVEASQELDIHPRRDHQQRIIVGPPCSPLRVMTWWPI